MDYRLKELTKELEKAWWHLTPKGSQERSEMGEETSEKHPFDPEVGWMIVGDVLCKMDGLFEGYVDIDHRLKSTLHDLEGVANQLRGGLELQGIVKIQG